VPRAAGWIPGDCAPFFSVGPYLPVNAARRPGRLLVLVLAGCQAPGFPGSPGADPGTDVETDAGDGPATSETTSPSDSTVGERIPSGGEVPDDPESDRLGWENGYWHNESVAVTPADGYNESELDAVVARSMARMELVRGLEFEEEVPVTVIDRVEYRNESSGTTARR